jgi:hypothetical protein
MLKCFCFIVDTDSFMLSFAFVYAACISIHKVGLTEINTIENTTQHDATIQNLCDNVILSKKQNGI